MGEDNEIYKFRDEAVYTETITKEPEHWAQVLLISEYPNPLTSASTG
jgi:hypothetical protein